MMQDAEHAAVRLKKLNCWRMQPIDVEHNGEGVKLFGYIESVSKADLVRYMLDNKCGTLCSRWSRKWLQQQKMYMCNEISGSVIESAIKRSRHRHRL